MISISQVTCQSSRGSSLTHFTRKPLKVSQSVPQLPPPQGQVNTPWKFNSSPLKICHPKRKISFQPSFFRGYVKLRGCTADGNLAKQLIWNISSIKKGFIHFNRCRIRLSTIPGTSLRFIFSIEHWRTLSTWTFQPTTMPPLPCKWQP